MGKPYVLKNKMLIKYFISKTKIIVSSHPHRGKVVVFIKNLNYMTAINCNDNVKDFEDSLRNEYYRGDDISEVINLKYKIIWELLK